MSAQREMFGQIAVRRGFVTPEQVEAALHVQREQIRERGLRKLLGMVLLELGTLGPSELIQVLKEIRAVSTARWIRQRLSGPSSPISRGPMKEVG